jgi:hypothetical protein
VSDLPSVFALLAQSETQFASSFSAGLVTNDLPPSGLELLTNVAWAGEWRSAYWIGTRNFVHDIDLTTSILAESVIRVHAIWVDDPTFQEDKPTFFKVSQKTSGYFVAYQNAEALSSLLCLIDSSTSSLRALSTLIVEHKNELLSMQRMPAGAKLRLLTQFAQQSNWTVTQIVQALGSFSFQVLLSRFFSRAFLTFVLQQQSMLASVNDIADAIRLISLNPATCQLVDCGSYEDAHVEPGLYVGTTAIPVSAIDVHVDLDYTAATIDIAYILTPTVSNATFDIPLPFGFAVVGFSVADSANVYVGKIIDYADVDLNAAWPIVVLTQQSSEKFSIQLQNLPAAEIALTVTLVTLLEFEAPLRFELPCSLFPLLNGIPSIALQMTIAAPLQVDSVSSPTHDLQISLLPSGLHTLNGSLLVNSTLSDLVVLVSVAQGNVVYAEANYSVALFYPLPLPDIPLSLPPYLFVVVDASQSMLPYCKSLSSLQI